MRVFLILCIEKELRYTRIFLHGSTKTCKTATTNATVTEAAAAAAKREVNKFHRIMFHTQYVKTGTTPRKVGITLLT